MTRKYSSTSVETTLATGISSTATSITVATGTASTLLGGVTLSPGNIDQFTVAIDPDTVNEEIVFVTGVTSDTLTVVRNRAGTSAITHSGGAVVRHVLTSDDLDYFRSGVDSSLTASSTNTLTNKSIALGTNTVTGTTAQFNTALTDGDFATLSGTEVLTNKDLTSGTNIFPSSITTTGGSQTLTGKTIDLGSNTLTGTIAQFNTALSNGDFATLAGTETLTNKTLTSPAINTATISNGIVVAPEERCTVSATAATGTINFDALTQGVLFYTTNASANFTLNFRGNSSTTLNSILTTGDSISLVFLNTNGTTAYYPTVFQIDGSAVTPKWSGGSAPAAGNASSIDAYSFTIIKTASTPTYTVLAGAVKFA